MERDTAREVVLAVFGVIVFIGGLLAVSVTYGGPNFAVTGSYALVGVVAGFLVVMTGIGFWLSTKN
jgi:hypothetical protein